MIHVLIGTRAQLIKMAPVIRELKDRNIDYNFIFLAQHKETMYEIMDQFGLGKPHIVVADWQKDITRSLDMVKWSLQVLGQGIRNKSRIFRRDKRGVVLIHGDAPPLLLGGVLAKLQGLKVAQVEAGLRSYNFYKPFPEELTRVLASKLGLIDIFFCQDAWATDNVKKHYNPKEVYCTQYNTMLDSLRIARNQDTSVPEHIPNAPYALVTVHRFETISSREAMAQVVEHVRRISKKIRLLFILHPPTRVALKKFDLYSILGREENIELKPRLGFFEFNRVFRNCEFIISDGGSNQEESYYLGIPCLLFREETERQEGLGMNVVLSNFDAECIDRFVEEYPNYRHPPLSDEVSPTRMIVDRLEPYR